MNQKLKLQPVSDLHLGYLEQHKFQLPHTKADAIVFAGDIGTGLRGIEAAARISDEHKKPAIYVAGNHEFYQFEYFALIEQLKTEAKNAGVHFLHRDTIKLNGVNIIGATLWTSFDFGHPDKNRHAKETAWLHMNDYVAIRYDGKPFTPDDSARLHVMDRKYLIDQLKSLENEKKVVITHHAPSYLCRHPDFMDISTNAAFVNEMDSLVKKADLWIYGHTHSSVDTMVGKCRLISNQRGYRNEKLPYPFRPDLVVQV